MQLCAFNDSVRSLWCMNALGFPCDRLPQKSKTLNSLTIGSANYFKLISTSIGINCYCHCFYWQLFCLVFSITDQLKCAPAPRCSCQSGSQHGLACSLSYTPTHLRATQRSPSPTHPHPHPSPTHTLTQGIPLPLRSAYNSISISHINLKMISINQTD